VFDGDVRYFQMNDIILHGAGERAAVEIGCPELGRRVHHKLLDVFIQKIGVVRPAGRQRKFSRYPSEEDVLVFVVIEKFLEHFIQEIKMLFNGNQRDSHNHIFKKSVFCRHFGHEGIPSLFPEIGRYRDFRRNESRSLDIHVYFSSAFVI
jgi:hypothetical protein